MRILITGATGFLGSRLTEAFSKNNTFTNIIATGRTLSPDRMIKKSHVQYLLGDLTDVVFVEKLFKQPIDYVVNCASLSSPWGSYESFFQANCITQKNIVQASQQAKIKRFIYISTPSIYFDFQDKIGIKESDPLPPQMINHYAATKLEAENFLRKSGLNYIILRPRALVGRGDTVIMPRLIRSHKEGRLKIMGSGKNQADLTPVSNMIHAIEQAITTSEKNCNEAYNISNGKPVNLWDSINEVLDLIGYKKVFRKIPFNLLYGLAYFLEWKNKLLNLQKEPVLTKYSVGVLAKSFTFDISKAKEKLNYRPQQSTREAIEEFAEWYLEREVKV